MEVLHEFGINWLLLAAQIVNFLIILYVLKRFAYKPILALLKQRQQTIKKGLEDAQKAHEELAKAQEKEKEILKKAQLEARSLLDAAKQQRVTLLAETEAQTKLHAERILHDAKEQIAFESKEAEKRLVAHVNTIAMSMLQKAASELFTKHDQELVIKQAVQKIKEKTN